MRVLSAWMCCAWSAAALFALQCKSSRHVHGVCEPAGEPVLVARTIGALALDGSALYYSSLAASEPAGSPALPEVWRVMRAGGQRQLLYRGSVPQALPFDALDADGSHVYFIEPCGPPEPAECAYLRRVPSAGNGLETIIRDRVAAFDLGADAIYYTTSDERGLQRGDPDGAVFAVAKHLGTQPAMLASGLTHLREVMASEHALYLSVATSARAGDATRRAQIARLPLAGEAGGSLEIVADLSGVGGARPIASVLAGDALIVYHVLEGWLRVPLDRGMPELLARPQNPIMDAAFASGVVYGVDPGRFEDTTDDDPGTYQCGAIWAAPAAGGEPTIWAAEQRQPTVIVADETEVYWASDELGEAPHVVRRLPRTPSSQ